MKNKKYMFQFFLKNFLSWFIIVLGWCAALLGVFAFQSLTTNPSNSGNQSLGSPILTKNGGTFNRDTQSLEAIARFLWIGGVTGYKRVFVTAATYNWNLWWVTGGDNICQTVANSQSLWWSWTALLSDPTSNFITRYGTDNTKYLYINLLWQPFFTSWLPGFFQNSWYRKNAWDFLTYNNLTNEAWVTIQNPQYWSSTNVNGDFVWSYHCLNWSVGTSNTWYYWYNIPNIGIDAVWNPSNFNYLYYYSTSSCTALYRLLCVEK